MPVGPCYVVPQIGSSGGQQYLRYPTTATSKYMEASCVDLGATFTYVTVLRAAVGGVLSLQADGYALRFAGDGQWYMDTAGGPRRCDEDEVEGAPHGLTRTKKPPLLPWERRGILRHSGAAMASRGPLRAPSCRWPRRPPGSGGFRRGSSRAGTSRHRRACCRLHPRTTTRALQPAQRGPR